MRRPNRQQPAHGAQSQAPGLGELERSEAQFRDLIEGAIQGILIDCDWKPVFANQALAEILGYDHPDEISALDSIAPHFAAHEREWLKRWSRARFAGEHVPNQYEFDAHRKDGTPIVLQNFVRLIEWEGAPATQCNIIDVTNVRRAENEAERVHRRLVDAIESIDGGFAAFDAEDRLVICNGKYRELTGHIDVMGRTFEAISRDAAVHYAGASEGLEQWLNGRMRLHRVDGAQLETKRQDGSWWRIDEHRTGEGGSVTISTEITELK